MHFTNLDAWLCDKLKMTKLYLNNHWVEKISIVAYKKTEYKSCW
jgi:hypothetical protein